MGYGSIISSFEGIYRLFQAPRYSEEEVRSSFLLVFFLSLPLWAT